MARQADFAEASIKSDDCSDFERPDSLSRELAAKHTTDYGLTFTSRADGSSTTNETVSKLR
jgi:hypothetical protein